MMKSIWKFGLLAGGITTVMMIISLPLMNNGTLSYKLAEVTGMLSMLLALSMVFFGIRERKLKEPGGLITFGQALKTGVLIALICSSMYTLAWMIITAIEPGISDKLMEMYYQSQAAKNLSTEELAQVQKMIENYKNPLFKLGMTLLEILPMGLVVALVSALILRSKKQ